jgi:excisionase family DNA binding protein
MEPVPPWLGSSGDSLAAHPEGRFSVYPNISIPVHFCLDTHAALLYHDPKIDEGRCVADYMKIPEVAQLLGLSEKTVRRRVKAGEIPSVFIGGVYRINRTDLNEYLKFARVRPGKASAPPSQPNFNHLLAEDRRTEETTRELERLRKHVAGTLERWERAARGEGPTLQIDYSFSLEAWAQVISLTEWLGELLREATVPEQRRIIGLIDELLNVGEEVDAVADANGGITSEQVEHEARALIDAKAQAIVAEQRPSDEVAQQRAEDRRRRYVKMRDETQLTARQRAAEVKKLAAGE